jgi:hypothetical protein
MTVGPGEYGPGKSCIEIGHLAPSFGIPHRAYDKVKRPGCEAERYGRESSGPGPALWQDVEEDGSKAHSFGKADRFQVFHSRFEKIPGPGQYRPEIVRTCMAVKANKFVVEKIYFSFSDLFIIFVPGLNPVTKPKLLLSTKLKNHLSSSVSRICLMFVIQARLNLAVLLKEVV